MDGKGRSLSAQALTAAGVTPASTLTHGGVALRWPSQAVTGAADNTVANGQYIALSGGGDTLGFLLSSSTGPVSGTGTIHYSDKTEQRFLLGGPDWHAGAGDAAVALDYSNAPGNTKQNIATALRYRGISLLSGKTPVSVELPKGERAEANGTPMLHVFAMALDKRASELTDTFGNVSVTQNTATNHGDMDGWGSSVSAQALTGRGRREARRHDHPRRPVLHLAHHGRGHRHRHRRGVRPARPPSPPVRRSPSAGLTAPSSDSSSPEPTARRRARPRSPTPTAPPSSSLWRALTG